MPSASEILPPPDTCSDPLSTGDPPCFYTTKLDLTVYTAEADVKVDKNISRELLRCTSKMPPSQLDYSLVYVGSFGSVDHC